MIEEGETIPDFKVLNQTGEKISSESIEDAVIYFYPKADTPGCTREACNFRDSISELEGLEMEVLGVSTDSVEDQKSFHEKNGLNFDLLADEDGEVSEKLGVLNDSGVAERTTFLVKNGEVVKIFRKVDPETHVEEVVQYLKN
ncbi:MAG: peroxiredoxin [Candidatus Nanohalobium sp.]